jgi:hypothetical protein
MSGERYVLIRMLLAVMPKYAAIRVLALLKENIQYLTMKSLFHDT